MSEAEPDMFCVDPTGNVLPFVPSANPPSPRNPGRCPEPLLAELLALNLEMIEQLRAERLSVVGTTHFLTGMIAHHEKAAALLRAQLVGSATDPA